MNNYARLSHVKGDVAGVGTAASATLDPVYVRGIDAVSREFERECSGRLFFSRRVTRYWQAKRTGCAVLTTDDDILSIESLVIDQDGDGVYETTLTPDTDWWISPQAAADEGEPYWSLELNPNSTVLSAWPTAWRSIKAVCILGWPEAWESAGTTAEALDTSETGVDLTALHTVELGDVVKVDDEQMYVSAFPSTNTATVTRGINGTTSASHLTSAPVSVRRYPADLEEAVRLRAIQTRWDNNSGNPLGTAIAVAGNSNHAGSYARWRAAIERYKTKGLR